MRVLWITPGFPADEHDGNCIPTMQLLAKAFMRQGVDLHIVALEYPFDGGIYTWQGAAVYPCRGRNSRWLKPRTLWRAMNLCHRILDAGAFAAIHSFWLGWASGIGEKISERRGIPHLTTLMGQDVLPQNRKFLRFVHSARTARLVAVSGFQNDVFEKNTGLRAAHVIPWGVEEAEIPRVLPATRSLDVLGAGSLVPVKSWEKWLNVIALAAQTKPGIRAELIGGGAEKGHLEAYARRLGLEGKVHFKGELPRAALLTRMQEAKVLLHTAHFESFGYVLAEAAMNGCRVVGTPVGAAAQLGTTAESEGQLAALVLDALTQPIQKQVVVPYTMQQTAEAYLKIYGLIKGGRD